MRIPQQVSDRVKEAPAQALRAVFAGIGQVLLVADRIRSRAAEANRTRYASAERPAQPAPHQTATVADQTRWRSLDKTGNVWLLPDDDVPEDDPVTAAPATATADPPTGETTAEPPAEAPSVAEEPPPTMEPPAAEELAAAEPAAAEPATAGNSVVTALPVPNYDGLTVASLRARLRNLDPPQLRVLIDYEKAHAGRADIVTMFERRIAKLESGEA